MAVQVLRQLSCLNNISCPVGLMCQSGVFGIFVLVLVGVCLALFSFYSVCLFGVLYFFSYLHIAQHLQCGFSCESSNQCCACQT